MRGIPECQGRHHGDPAYNSNGAPTDATSKVSARHAKPHNTTDNALQNLDVYIREVRREQVLGPFAVGTIRFRKDHDPIFCYGLLHGTST